MRQKSSCSILIFIFTFYSLPIFGEIRASFESARDDRFNVQSFPKMIQDNIRGQPLYEDPWDSLIYKTTPFDGPSNYELFKEDMRLFGGGVWKGCKLFGKGIAIVGKEVICSPATFAKGIANGIDAVSDWAEVRSATQNPQEDLKKQQELPKEQTKEEKQRIYKNQITTILQHSHNNLVTQYELYQELEIETVYENKEIPAYIIKRIEGLKDYSAGNDVWKEETYQLSITGQELLTAHNIPSNEYLAYFGSTIQRALHQEFIDTINDAADLIQTHNMYTSLEDPKRIASTLTQFAHAGQLHNHAGYIKDSFLFADFCHEFLGAVKHVGEIGLDIGTALGKGAWIGCKNFSNKVVHPIDTSINAIKGFANVTVLVIQIQVNVGKRLIEFHEKFMARAKQEMLDLSNGKMTIEDIMMLHEQAKREAWNVTSVSVKNALNDLYDKVTYHNTLYLLEKGAEITTESLLTGITLKALAGLAANASNGLSNIIEGADPHDFFDLPLNSNTFEAAISYPLVAPDAIAAAARTSAALANVVDKVADFAPFLAMANQVQNANSGSNKIDDARRAMTPEELLAQDEFLQQLAQKMGWKVCFNRILPSNSDDLEKIGWQNITHAEAFKNNPFSSKYRHHEYGIEIRLDKAQPGEHGFKGVDHYQIINPLRKKMRQKFQYLDLHGNALMGVPDEAHIVLKNIKNNCCKGN